MNAGTCTIIYKKRDISIKAIEKFYKSLEKHYTTVGVHRAEGQEVINSKGFTLIRNACIQEFGNTQVVQKPRRFKSPFTGKWFFLKEGSVINIPPRVFIRIFTEKRIQEELTNELKQVIEQNKFKNALEVYKQVGDFAKLKMKSRLLGNQIKPKNAPMTVAYKGTNTPLYLTGKLANSIKSEVH